LKHAAFTSSAKTMMSGLLLLAYFKLAATTQLLQPAGSVEELLKHLLQPSAQKLPGRSVVL
jgi:hypothetical protein